MTASHRSLGNGLQQLAWRSIRRERRARRDLALNEVRRRKDENYPAAEMHFLCWGSGLSTAFALLEYQHEKGPEQDLTQPRYQAMIDLGDQTGVPVFAVRYASDLSWWRVTPLNQLARDLLPEQQTMSEQDWKLFLNVLSGLQPPLGLFDQAGVLM